MAAADSPDTPDTPDAPALTRVHRSDRPLQLGSVVSIFRRGGGDPTSWTDRGSTWVFAWRVPTGPLTLRLVDRPRLAEVHAEAWGPGAEWILDRLPQLLGEDDDDSGFETHHDLVAQTRRRFPGWRVPASGLVVQALIPTIIEQRVTGKEAFAAYRNLVRRNGTRAPGIGERLGLFVPPEPKTWALIPSWEWLREGVDGARSRPAVLVAGRAGRLEECVGMPSLDARRRLEAVPGVGRWTANEVAHRALGDADAVSFGDYHVAKNIGFALTGSDVDDDGLAELLEPYAGHRYRVQRYVELSGVTRPRRGPRFTLPTHLP
ncbi:DNA-3-methyladenine glycosylase family protein [Knoellia subterranea]|uniref:3-methyladenine DNA glycosylase n=1 Tax=Knoellia subterranea KCTC 19937 TaxID=1385521 RepID=A0A0A0JJL3_9MICO|nr:DNA-3-methyladenine glycosylase [Knoellia subterranea]KGN36954.1 3-methyladenine DNA glycosylase [Knoellia subterranea KCTC 19937]